MFCFDIKSRCCFLRKRGVLLECDTGVGRLERIKEARIEIYRGYSSTWVCLLNDEHETGIFILRSCLFSLSWYSYWALIGICIYPVYLQNSDTQQVQYQPDWKINLLLINTDYNFTQSNFLKLYLVKYEILELVYWVLCR